MLKYRPLSHISQQKIDRFWSRVDDSGGPDSCWPWQLSRFPTGYGHAILHGREYAHRIAYELATGNDPRGLDVCHTCDNPPCCNPAHLFAGTALDNMRDRDAKGRDRWASFAPLRERAHELRSAGLSFTDIAENLGVRRSTVYGWFQSEPKPSRKPRKVMSELERYGCRQMRKEGHSYQSIADAMGVNVSTAWLAINQEKN